MVILGGFNTRACLHYWTAVALIIVLVSCGRKSATTRLPSEGLEAPESNKLLAIAQAELRVSEYDSIVQKYSRRYGFDWLLISAQIFAESSFRADAVSYAGALGLMQIMPGTAKWLGTDPRLLFEPETNISLGVYYDFWIYTRVSGADSENDRISLMLGSYNAGPARIGRIRKQVGNGAWSDISDFVPAETRAYVHRIWTKYDEYRAMKS